MKHIKEYKIFEANNHKENIEKINELIQLLEDYCLEFKDANLSVNISPKNELEKNAIGMMINYGIPLYKEIPFYIKIHSNRYHRESQFNYRDLIPTIESICLLMDDNGFNTEVILHDCTFADGSATLKEPEEISMNSGIGRQFCFYRLTSFNKSYPSVDLIEIIFTDRNTQKL